MEKPSLTTLKNYKLYMAVFGDVHTGHSKTPTSHILRNLRRAFPNTPATGDLDLIVIEGDFFDQLLQMNDPAVKLIHEWVGAFLWMCKERDIVLRVLEGTPSHDWKQNSIFTTVNEVSKIGADVKYVDELSIEYIERFDIHVLYVPDEWRVKCDDTWDEVVQLLVKNNLDKVDFAFMHGMFPHQMPKNLHGKMEMHDPARYRSIVNKYICIGHVHGQSQNGNILAAGSFDRTAHGEEAPKGHYRIRLEPNQEDVVMFIPNKDALKYVTFDCTGIDNESIHSYVEQQIANLPEGSHVRLKAMKGEAAIAGIKYFQDAYPQFHWTVKESGKDDEKYTPVLVDTRKLHKTVNITPSNIESLVLERIEKKHPNLLKRAAEALKEIIYG